VQFKFVILTDIGQLPALKNDEKYCDITVKKKRGEMIVKPAAPGKPSVSDD